MRASRLLSVMMLLQARGRISAQTLADELEVSVRTVYRDVDHLSAAGVPVTATRGAAGGFELLDGWRTRLTGLTPNEAQAMLLAGAPGPAEQLGLGEAAASAQLKLLAALPPQWQADARRVGSRLHLDPVGWYRSADRAEHLNEVAQAVWNDRRLNIRYESWKGVGDRIIEPLGLVQKAGEWYVVARSHNQLRTFRLSRVQQLEVRPGKFARPRKFDLAKYWATSIERFEAGLYRGTAVVRITALGMQRLKGFSAAVAEAANCTRSRVGADGWSQVTIPIESIEYAAIELLRLGSEGEVLKPKQLRERVANTVRALAQIYGPGSRGDL
jgi:predicted DNA-binding transcriptional regulator YafY